MPGTPSSISPGKSCLSHTATGPSSVTQSEDWYYSIATGIGLGFITYALAKLIAGKFADLKPAVLVLALIFVIKFWIG